MLLMLQAVVPPINVTVQQPPGLSAWTTALISAAVGAAFALTTNVAMEFAKPYISKRITGKRVRRELSDELLANMQHVENAIYIIEDARQRGGNFLDRARETLPLMLDQFGSDRYELHFDNEKAIYYELDPAGSLSEFYLIVKEHLPRALRLTGLEPLELVALLLRSVGQKYATTHGLASLSVDPYWRDMYLKMPDDGTLPLVP